MASVPTARATVRMRVNMGFLLSTGWDPKEQGTPRTIGDSRLGRQSGCVRYRQAVEEPVSRSRITPWQTVQNGWLIMRMRQLNSGRKAPQWK